LKQQLSNSQAAGFSAARSLLFASLAALSDANNQGLMEEWIAPTYLIANSAPAARMQMEAA
jgi:hypothetical protein